MADTGNIEITIQNNGENMLLDKDKDKLVFNGWELPYSSIRLKKEMYKPGCVELECILQDVPSSTFIKDAKNYLFPPSGERLKVSIKAYQTTEEGKEPTDVTTIASDYLVYDAKVSCVKRDVINAQGTQETRKVTALCIKAYSPDYELTLKKSCNVYRGKTLSSIITGDGKQTLVSNSKLCHTTIGDTEMLQPYLVQYNESFYDFIVRTTNRCGELFYYEEGNAVLGVNPTYLTSDNQDIKFVKPAIKDLFGEITLGNSLGIADNPNYPKTLLQEDVYKTPSETSVYRDENVGMDEALRVVTGDDSIEVKDIVDPHLFEIGHEAFKADGLAQMVSKAVSTVANNYIQAALAKSIGKLGISDDEKKFSTKYSTNQGASNAKRMLSNEFYSWVEGIEKKISAGMQEIHYSGLGYNDTLMLGEFVKIKGLSGKVETKTDEDKDKDKEDDFYVYSVDLKLDTIIVTGQQQTPPCYTIDLNVRYCPLLAKTDEATANERDETKEYQKRVFPPLAEVPHIRKAGAQQAIVTNIADPLRNGRVQICYPWQKKEQKKNEKTGDLEKDKYEETSPWVSIATPFTGKEDSGFLMTPDVEDYVMVNYEDGNIERPYIEGSLFHKNKAATNWGATAMNKFQMDFRSAHRAITSNGNGITFVPGSASSFIANLFPSVLAPAINAMGKNTTGKNGRLGGGMILSDYYGMYSISMSSATRSVNIDSPWGSVGINAFTGITINAPNGDIKISGKNVSIEAGNKVTIVSGKNIKKDGWGADATKAFASALGSVLGSTVNSALKQSWGLDLTKLVDMSFLRSVYEIAMRPVDGSLTLKSKHNLLLEAGQGKVVAPASTLSQVTVPENGGNLGFFKITKVGASGSTEMQQAAKLNVSENMGALLYAVSDVVDRVIDDFYAELCAFRSKFRSINRNIFYLGEGRSETCMLNTDNAKPWNTLEKFIDQMCAENLDALPAQSVLFSTNYDNVEPNGPGSKNKRDIDNNYKVLQDVYIELKAMRTRLLNKLDIVKDCQDEFTKSSYYAGMSNKDNYGISGNLTDIFVMTDDAKKEVLSGMFGLSGENLNTGLDILKHHVTKDISLDEAANGMNAVKSKYKKAIFWNIANTSANIAFVDNINVTKREVDPITQVAAVGDSWVQLKQSVKGFDVAPQPSKTASFISNVLEGAGLSDLASYDENSDSWTAVGSAGKLFNVNGHAGPRTWWDGTQQGGTILFSSDTETYQLKSSASNIEAQIQKVARINKKRGLEE